MIPVATIQGEACCAPLAESPLAPDDAETLARSLKALADPARLRILSLVAASPEGEICVCELPAPLGLTQPTVSHHLKVLTEAGFLRREKRGTWAWFRLVPGALDKVTRPLAEPAAVVA